MAVEFNYAKLGARIRKKRRELGLSQEMLAERRVLQKHTSVILKIRIPSRVYKHYFKSLMHWILPQTSFCMIMRMYLWMSFALSSLNCVQTALRVNGI